MTKKKPRNKNPKNSRVQAPRAGPQNTRRPVTKTNGVSASTHHLRLHMGKRPGMQTANGKAACENWLEPMANSAPVVPMASTCMYMSGATTAVAHCAAPTAGRWVQVRKNYEVTVGTGGVGYILAVAERAGRTLAADMCRTSATYAGTDVNIGVTTGVTQQSSLNSATPEGWCYVAGHKMTLSVNNVQALNRNGKVYAYAGPANIAAIGLGFLDITPFAQAYSNNVFTEDDEVVVRTPIVTKPNYVDAAFTGTLFNQQDQMCHGLIFTGTAGDTYTVTIEGCAFFWGAGSANGPVPKSIVPYIDTAAIECLAACAASIRGMAVGNTEGDSSHHRRKITEHSERAIVRRTPAPFLSSLWPAVEKLARTAGPALLQGIAGLI